jgi:hypothetical protein
MQLANSVYPEFRNGQMKWLASDVLNAGPYAQIGNVWYVDAVNGSDTANNGAAWNSAFKTLYAAHNAATTNNYDVIVVAPAGTGSGTGTDESVYGAWTFSKSLITVIGSSSPTAISPRSRILWNTAGQSTSLALLTISGAGNSFYNIQLGTFVDNNILVTVTGNRNYFGSVHFAGIGVDTAGDDVAARSVVISGAGENRFVDCTIGLDTVARSTTNASLELTGSCDRNRFENCLFPMFADNSGALFVKAVTGNCYQRFVVFDGCIFLNAVDGSATTITAGISNAGTGNGTLLMRDCWMHGATDLCGTSYTNVYVTNPTVNTANQTFPVIAAT